MPAIAGTLGQWHSAPFLAKSSNSMRQNNRHMRALALLALLCPFLQGCVGVAVMKPRREIINDPVIASVPNDADPVHNRKSSEPGSLAVYTSKWLRTHWDTPKRAKHTPGDSEEVWTYNFRP